MRRINAVLAAVFASSTAIGATAFWSSPPDSAVSREVIAVYLGTSGTDAKSGMASVVHEMRFALSKQAAASGRRFVLRGVSLEPTVEAGLQHLALLGPFDEVSVGGNWTNSTVVRYLGATMTENEPTAIPQVVILEREVRRDSSTLQIGAERELARYAGVDKIGEWVRRGASLKR